MLPPALVDAANDPGMMGTPIEILVRCWCVWLEPWRHRPLPLAAIVDACHVEKMTASRTLAYLVECGYLELGPPGERGARTYRVLMTRNRTAA